MIASSVTPRVEAEGGAGAVQQRGALVLHARAGAHLGLDLGHRGEHAVDLAGADGGALAQDALEQAAGGDDLGLEVVEDLGAHRGGGGRAHDAAPHRRPEVVGEAQAAGAGDGVGERAGEHVVVGGGRGARAGVAVTVARSSPPSPPAMSFDMLFVSCSSSVRSKPSAAR